MKNLLFILSVATLLFSCGNLKHKSNVADKFAGTWTEEWLGETDVNYVDTIQFISNGSDLTIRCLNTEDYAYDEIEIEGNQLKFRMQNISNTNEAFYIWYTLTINDKGNKMLGETLNIRDTKTNVRFDRIQE